MKAIDIKLDPLSVLMSYEQVEAHRPDVFPVERIKYFVRFRDKNGLAESKAIIKAGKSFLINYEKFANWYLEYAAIAA